MAVPLTPEEAAAAGYTPGGPLPPTASLPVTPADVAGISPADVGAQVQRNLAAAGVGAAAGTPPELSPVMRAALGQKVGIGDIMARTAERDPMGASGSSMSIPDATLTKQGLAKPPDASAPEKPIGPPPAGATPVGGAAPTTPLALMIGRGGGGGAAAGTGKRIGELMGDIAASQKRQQGNYTDVAGMSKAAGEEQENAAYSRLAGMQNAQTAAETIQKDREDIEKKADAKIAAYREQRAKDMAAVKDVDPEHYWHSQGTPDKIRMALGVALGAIGASLGKTANFAQNMFDDAVKRDVESQRSNIEKQWKQIAGKSELAKDDLARSTYISDQMRQKMQMGYEMVAKMSDAHAAVAQSAEAKARLGQVSAGAMDRVEQIEQGAKAQEIARLQAQAAAAGGPSPLAALKNDWDKYYKSQIEKGETPRSFDDYARERMTGRVAGAAGAAGGDPLANVPKTQLTGALKEQEDKAKVRAAGQMIEKLYGEWDATSITSPRQLEAINAQIATRIKTAAGPGMSSDKDFDTFIKPNLPKWGEGAEALAKKAARVKEVLDSSAPTPILDRHAPGLFPAAVTTPSGAKPRGQ